MKKIFISTFFIIIITLITLTLSLFIIEYNNKKPKTITYYIINRKNADGTSDLWRIFNNITIKGSFVIWKDKNGKKVLISGDLLITEYEINKNGVTSKK